MRADLYLDLLGKPFEWGGRGPDSFDCYGLVKFVLGRNGINIPDYPSNKSGVLNSLMILSEMRKFEKSNAEDGAVAVFRMDFSGPSHVGIVVDRNAFLHITENTQVVREELSAPLWNRRIVGFYKWTS